MYEKEIKTIKDLRPLRNDLIKELNHLKELFSYTDTPSFWSEDLQNERKQLSYEPYLFLKFKIKEACFNLTNKALNALSFFDYYEDDKKNFSEIFDNSSFKKEFLTKISKEAEMKRINGKDDNDLEIIELHNQLQKLCHEIWVCYDIGKTVYHNETMDIFESEWIVENFISKGHNENSIRRGLSSHYIKASTSFINLQ